MSNINIANIIKFGWQYRHAISGSFKGLPALPESWENSEEARRWFQAVLESPLCIGLVTDYPGSWDDKLRLDLLLLTNQNVVWETIWSFFTHIDNNTPVPPPPPDKTTLRVRLSKLLHFRQQNAIPSDTFLPAKQLIQAAESNVVSSNIPLSEEETEGVLEIISIISLITTVLRFLKERKKKQS